MNNLEKKMVNTLIDLRENHHVIGIKAEFEGKGYTLPAGNSEDIYLYKNASHWYGDYAIPNDAEYYLNLFNQNDKNYHYEIELKDNRICKFYKYDYSLMSALDEFIRFFIYLDTYMRDNNIA